jgi:hypothetical protein
MPLHPHVVTAIQGFDTVCTANTDAYYAIEHESAGSARAPVPRRARTAADQLDSSDLEPLSVFHTREYVAMSLADLAGVMRRSTRTNDETALVALVLCCRYNDRNKARITRHMMHRLYVTALYVALKVHSDYTYSNKSYAKLAGVAPAELLRLEAALCEGLDWNLLVTVPNAAFGPRGPNIVAVRCQKTNFVAYGSASHRLTSFNFLLDYATQMATSASRVARTDDDGHLVRSLDSFGSLAHSDSVMSRHSDLLPVTSGHPRNQSFSSARSTATHTTNSNFRPSSSDSVSSRGAAV